MARYFIKPFAEAGDKNPIPNDLQVSGSVSYETGFGLDYQRDMSSDPLAKALPRPESNQLYYDITLAIQQYQQNGVPDFITTSDNAGTPYPYGIYARVRYNDGGGFKVYESIVSSNTSLPTDATKWNVVSAIKSAFPPGAFMNFGGATPPAGFLLRNGAAVSRTTYAALFAAVGTLWGPGDGSTTFNLPNSPRRVEVAAGGTGTAVLGNAVGNVGGLEAQPILIANLPAHDHSKAGFAGGSLGSGGNGPYIQNVSSPIGTFNLATDYTQNVGGDVALNVMQPGEVTLPCIAY